MRQDFDIAGYWWVTVVYNVWLGQKDSGFTYTDFNKRRSIVGVSVYTSKEELINTIVHEAKHV